MMRRFLLSVGGGARDYVESIGFSFRTLATMLGLSPGLLRRRATVPYILTSPHFSTIRHAPHIRVVARIVASKAAAVKSWRHVIYNR